MNKLNEMTIDEILVFLEETKKTLIINDGVVTGIE